MDKKTTIAKNNKTNVEDNKSVTKNNKTTTNTKNNKPLEDNVTSKKVPVVKKTAVPKTNKVVENIEIVVVEKPVGTKKPAVAKNNKVVENTIVEKPVAVKKQAVPKNNKVVVEKPVATKKQAVPKNNKTAKVVEETKVEETKVKETKVFEVDEETKVLEVNEESENNHEFTEEEEEISKNYEEIDAELQQKHMIYMNTTPEDITDTIGIFNLWQQIDMFARNITFWDLEFDKLPEPEDIKSATRIVMVTESQRKSRDIVESKFSEFIGQKIMERAEMLYKGEKKLIELRELNSTKINDNASFINYAISSYQ